MIPRSDIDVAVDVDPTQLASVTAETVIHGIGCVHEYEPAAFAAATWGGAEEAVNAEWDELRRIDAASPDGEAFDEAAFEAQAELALSFEFGVSGAVEALCAAGCPTFASCRGHGEGFGGRSRHPWILFATHAARLPALSAAARTSGCSLALDQDRLIVMCAPSVAQSIKFGRALIDSRADFDAIPPMVDREAAVPDEDDERW